MPPELSTNMLIEPTQLHYHPLPRLKRNMPACMCVNVLVENCLYENSAKYFSLRSHEKRTRNNSVSLNIPSVRNEFSKGSVYFSGAKLYNELLHVQIQQLESFEKFRKTINTFFD